MLFTCSCVGFTRDAEIRYLNAFILKVQATFVSDFHDVLNQNKFFQLPSYKVSLTHEKQTYLHSASYITADNLIIFSSGSGYRMIFASNR